MTDFTKDKKMELFKIDEHVELPEMSGMFKIYYQHYWIVSPDGEHVYRYNGHSWQCNKNKGIVERMLSSYKDCTVKLIERFIVLDV